MSEKTQQNQFTSIHSPKRYQCSRCGYEQVQKTNHWGQTYSFGHVSVCPKCPPFAKYPEHGGQTIWKCVDQITDN